MCTYKGYEFIKRIEKLKDGQFSTSIQFNANKKYVYIFNIKKVSFKKMFY